MTKTFRIWAFGFRYCLVFSASDLGFIPCLTATLHDFVLRALALPLSCSVHLVLLGDNGSKSLDIPVD